MKRKTNFLLLTLSTLFCFGFMFNNEVIDKLLKGLAKNIILTPHEKIYLTTDRPHYLLNDTLWFSAWVTNASDHSKNPVSQLLYVQLVDQDDKIILKINIPLFDKNGSGFLPLNFIKEDNDKNTYSLQAYTAYMLNYDPGYIFSREITIWSGTNQLNTSAQNTFEIDEKQLKFYPEGGNIIANIDNNIAFEIKQKNNQVTNSFSVVDENNNTLAITKPTFNGMGSFTIKPNTSSQLYALIDDKKIQLPKILDKGYNLLVSNRGSDNIKIIAQTNIPNGLGGAFVICHQRGEEIAISQPMTGNTMAFRVNKSELKDGVAQITLFDKSGIPLAERSVFIYHPEKQPKFEISQKYEYFNTRSLIDLEGVLAMQDGSPLEGDFCVSVVDLNEVNHHEENLDIKSFFLLTSDLTREIFQPSFYFKNFDPKKNALLDLTMLVHGWTRFKSEDLMKEDEISLEYAPERGVTISGRVVDKSGKGISKSKVDLSILNVQGSYVDQADCSRNGRFVFYDVPLLKDQLVFLKAYEEVLDKKKKSKSINEKVIIQLDDPKAIQVTSDNYSKVIWQKDFQPHKFLNKALEKQRDDSSYAMIKITLDEIEIKSFKTEQLAKKERDIKLQKERGMIYSMYDSRIFMDSLRYVNVNWTVMDYVANLTPGAALFKNAPDPPMLILRNKMRPPSYYLDGFPVEFSAIANIDINTVEFIDVLRSSMTSVAFGDLAYGGVILVYTKPPQESKANDNDRKAKNVATYIGQGFLEAREFYSPDYSKISFTKPDNRTTLFWSPLISTDVNGRSNFKFYSCDKKSLYLVKIEGLTSDGKPFSAYHQFEVK